MKRAHFRRNSLFLSVSKQYYCFIRRFGRDASRTMRKSCVMRVVKCVITTVPGNPGGRESPPPDSTQFLGKRKGRREKERAVHGSIRILRIDVTRVHRRDAVSRGRRDVSDLYKSNQNRRDEETRGVIFIKSDLRFSPGLDISRRDFQRDFDSTMTYLAISDTFQ